MLPLLVAEPRGAGALRGHPQDRSRHRRALGSGRRAAGGGCAVLGLHARPASPRLLRRARGADRGPLGADDRRNALGGVVHGDRRGRRRGDLLRARGRRRPLLCRLRRVWGAGVLHARALPQARGGPDRGAPARRAICALAGGGDRGARIGRPGRADDHLAGRGVAPAGVGGQNRTNTISLDSRSSSDR